MYWIPGVSPVVLHNVSRNTLVGGFVIGGEGVSIDRLVLRTPMGGGGEDRRLKSGCPYNQAVQLE